MGLLDSMDQGSRFGTPESPNVQYRYDDFAQRYNTPIPEDKQKDFVQWLTNLAMKRGSDPRQDYNDYDIQGAFLDSMSQDGRGHMGDKFKKPSHPTFSDQSQYSGVDGYNGGHWAGNAFYPSTTNMQMSSPGFLQNYFSRVEPGYGLMVPVGGMVLNVTGDGSGR